MVVEMKDHTSFNDKEEFFNYTMAAEPKHCIDSDNHAETILEISIVKKQIYLQ